MNINKNLIIIIPAYNEVRTIKKVVLDWLKIAQKYSGKLLLINDGSTDGTFKILKNLKNKNLILLNQKNSGHCKSIINGYKYAVNKNYKYIFQVDSDDQFSPKDFTKFWRQKDYDFILGYRKKRYDNISRLIITRILILFIIVKFQIFINDANVPYRLINGGKLKMYFDKFKNQKFIPNILLSIFFFKNFKSKTIIITHKKRKFGNSWIVSYKLFKFCINSIIQILKFDVNKL